MERIMKQKKYLKSPEYNTDYVSQLLDNYRSHPAILSYSNTQFYQSSLRAKASPAIINAAVNWSELPNKEIPIIFHSVMKPCRRDEDVESWYNYHEIDLIKKYLKMLIDVGINGKKISQKNIGIMSPYRSQINILDNKLAHYPGVEIGVIENFQGCEKDVIIISMVKSNAGIGFLNSEKVC